MCEYLLRVYCGGCVTCRTCGCVIRKREIEKLVREEIPVYVEDG